MKQHGLKGRKQTLEHIQKRVKAIEETKAQWTEERKQQFIDRWKESNKELSINNQARFKGRKLSEETKKKISLAKKGVPLSEEARKKCLGRIPWNKGLKMINEPWNKGKKMVKPAWNKGMKMSEEYCAKLSKSHMGKIHTEEAKRKIGIGAKGNKYALGSKGWCAGLTKETDERIRLKAEKQKGYKHTKEAKKIIGMKSLGRIPWNKGLKGCYTDEQLQRYRMGHAGNKYEGRRWNKKSIPIFEWLDKNIFGSKGQYATNGGEYIIEGLRYSVDYINHEAKVIIEWDEEAHYFNDKLRDNDKLRQKRIEKVFPDYDFIRIRESQINYFMLCLLVGMRYKKQLKG